MDECKADQKAAEAIIKECKESKWCRKRMRESFKTEEDALKDRIFQLKVELSRKTKLLDNVNLRLKE